MKTCILIILCHQSACNPNPNYLHVTYSCSYIPCLRTPLSPISTFLYIPSCSLTLDFLFFLIHHSSTSFFNRQSSKFRMSWQLPTFRIWSYAFTFASGGLVATLLLRSRLHTSVLSPPDDRPKKHAFIQEAPQDSVDARSMIDPSEAEKIDGGVKFLKKMIADKCSDDNEQKLGADDLQHEHVGFLSLSVLNRSFPS